MRIKEFTYQNRRDFKAIFECEHCGNKEEKWGYDDTNYHKKGIPNMECSKCKQKAPSTYRPLTTKYPDGMHV